MRTKHMEDRVQQRCFSAEAIKLIQEYGDWNERGDRIILTRRACIRAERALRKDIAELEFRNHIQKSQPRRLT